MLCGDLRALLESVHSVAARLGVVRQVKDRRERLHAARECSIPLVAQGLASHRVAKRLSVEPWIRSAECLRQRAEAESAECAATIKRWHEERCKGAGLHNRGWREGARREGRAPDDGEGVAVEHATGADVRNPRPHVRLPHLSTHNTTRGMAPPLTASKGGPEPKWTRDWLLKVETRGVRMRPRTIDDHSLSERFSAAPAPPPAAAPAALSESLISLDVIEL